MPATRQVHSAWRVALLLWIASVPMTAVAVVWMLSPDVLYTPYLQHPDGTVKRQSGLLAPAFGSSSVLGQFYAQPWFQTLGPSADVTIEPILFSKENPVLAAEYRQRFASGAISLNGSITNGTIYDDNNRSTGEETIRNHIAGTGRLASYEALMIGRPAIRNASIRRPTVGTIFLRRLTSLPKVAPKPPGSMKSRCMSITISAVCAGSNENAKG